MKSKNEPCITVKVKRKQDQEIPTMQTTSFVKKKKIADIFKRGKLNLRHTNMMVNGRNAVTTTSQAEVFEEDKSLINYNEYLYFYLKDGM